MATFNITGYEEWRADDVGGPLSWADRSIVAEDYYLFTLPEVGGTYPNFFQQGFNIIGDFTYNVTLGMNHPQRNSPNQAISYTWDIKTECDLQFDIRRLGNGVVTAANVNDPATLWALTAGQMGIRSVDNITDNRLRESGNTSQTYSILNTHVGNGGCPGYDFGNNSGNGIITKVTARVICRPNSNSSAADFPDPSIAGVDVNVTGTINYTPGTTRYTLLGNTILPQIQV